MNLLASDLPGGFMSETGRDVVSLVSFAFTVVGLVYAILQIWKTKSAADAAKKAADESLAESKRSYHRYAAANTHRLINEAKIHVENKSWPLAAFRLNDVADQVAQLASADPLWKDFASQLRGWETACQGQARGIQRGFAVQKWSDFIILFQGKIDDGAGPFSANT